MNFENFETRMIIQCRYLRYISFIKKMNVLNVVNIYSRRFKALYNLHHQPL